MSPGKDETRVCGYMYIYIYSSKAVVRGLSMGECSRSMHRVCSVASVWKYDFSKAAMQLCWGHTSAQVFSCEFAPYFQGTSLW